MLRASTLLLRARPLSSKAPVYAPTRGRAPSAHNNMKYGRAKAFHAAALEVNPEYEARGREITRRRDAYMGDGMDLAATAARKKDAGGKAAARHLLAVGHALRGQRKSIRGEAHELRRSLGRERAIEQGLLRGTRRR